MTQKDMDNIAMMLDALKMDAKEMISTIEFIERKLKLNKDEGERHTETNT